MSMTRWRILRYLTLGTALAVAALAVACDSPKTDPAPSPAPSSTAAPAAVAPSKKPTPTSPDSAPTPTATSAHSPGPTLAPTAIGPAPTATNQSTPEPTLQERIEGLFSDYWSNAPFDDHLRKLSDYQDPTPASLSSFEALAGHAKGEFQLTRRAAIAAGFLGLDSSEANLTIDAYLKHQQKYDLQDPTGFASVTDLILFQNQLNTPGTIKLPDGSEEDRRSHILSSEEKTEALIAGADIWSRLALPERGLQTTPDWYERSYPGRSPNPQIVGGLPFSLNASTDIRFSAAPVFTDDEALGDSEQSIGIVDYEGYTSLNEIRRQHLDMLEIQPNATAKDLEALATGTLNDTEELVSEVRRGTEVYTERRLWERSREDAASRYGPRADVDVAADA